MSDLLTAVNRVGTAWDQFKVALGSFNSTEETQCGVCGDYHHSDQVPYVCETGDGI